jgi:peptidoglycan/xylan/chitin deacetylase (PgdA/CDA1 family)
MQKDKTILLSFDVEEFDLPVEYGINISKDEQLQVGYRGLQMIKPLLDRSSVQATLFTTAFFAGHFPEIIRSLSGRHEIGSHSFFHSSFNNPDLAASKLSLENITGKKVEGLRMPRMKQVDPGLVLEAGYSYNSSVNPTWIPGRYNHLGLPRTPWYEKHVLQFPVSVTPHFRVPLFWLAFKNLPYSFFLDLVLRTLRHDGYVCLYFHPWEFIDLSGYKLPSYLKKGSKRELYQKLEKLVNDLSSEGSFSTMNDFIKQHYKPL